MKTIPKYVEHTVSVRSYGNSRENTSKTIPKYVERMETAETKCNTVPMYVALYQGYLRVNEGAHLHINTISSVCIIMSLHITLS